MKTIDDEGKTDCSTICRTRRIVNEDFNGRRCHSIVVGSQDF